MSGVLFLVLLAAAIAATVAVAFGAHIYAWEYLAWIWCAVISNGVARLNERQP